MHTRLFGIIALTALTLAVCFAAPAAGGSETTTYVDGTLPGIAPNTGGTLVLSDEKALSFRTGLTTVSVPYASVTHVELGATKETSHDVPVYKVWALHKRFGGKTQTQLLIVNFKNEAGENNSMTLEVAKTSASGVFSTLQSRTVEHPAEEKSLVASEPAAEGAEASKVASTDVKNDTPKSAKESKKEARLEAKQAKEDKEAEKEAAKQGKAAWWGDDYWKTNRNADKWNQKAPAPAPTSQNNNN